MRTFTINRIINLVAFNTVQTFVGKFCAFSHGDIYTICTMFQFLPVHTLLIVIGIENIITVFQIMIHICKLGIHEGIVESNEIKLWNSIKKFTPLLKKRL